MPVRFLAPIAEDSKDCNGSGNHENDEKMSTGYIYAILCSLGERYSIAENIVGLESRKEFKDFYHRELQVPSTTS